MEYVRNMKCSFRTGAKTVLGLRAIDSSFPGRSPFWAHLMESCYAGGRPGRAWPGKGLAGRRHNRIYLIQLQPAAAVILPSNNYFSHQ